MKERRELRNEEGGCCKRIQRLCMRKTSGAAGEGKMREAKNKVCLKPKRMKKERVTRGKEKRRKKRTKRRESKRKCEVVFLWRPLKSLVKKEVWSCGDLSWVDLVEKREDLSDCEPDSCAHVRVVPDVTVVLVSPFSVVTEFCEVSSCCSYWEDVVPQSFSFSKKRALCCTSTQEEMRFEVSQGKTPPLSRRRMMPPTPLQNRTIPLKKSRKSYDVESW